MEIQKVTAIVFLDLSAAFDTMDHDIMHHVLETTFNVKGHCLSFLDTYLAPRWCCVAIGNAYSQDKQLNFLVPQSSCMGLTLYTLYASTLNTVIPASIQIHGYADDHALKEGFSPVTPGM